MIKAIFFDIDGTLVSFRTHTVPESTRKALNQLHEQGVKLFIATGRPKLLINNLDDLEFDGYITLNGAHCFTADYHDIYKGSIPPNDIEQLVSYCKNHDYPFVFVHDNEWFITHVNADVEEISRLIAIPVPPVRPIEEALQTDILQTMGYFKAEADEEIFRQVLPHCEPMRWHPLFADIIARGNSKSRGIDEVIAYYGLRLEETMAFGDGGNDIPMLKHAGIGVAMGNASPEIQAAADYVTTSVDDDGILNALRHFKILA